jgi:hypothetical protein
MRACGLWLSSGDDHEVAGQTAVKVQAAGGDDNGGEEEPEEEEEHVGVVERWVVVLRQTARDTLWRTFPPPPPTEAADAEAAVRRYLQAHILRAGDDAQWAKTDATFAKRRSALPGLRLLAVSILACLVAKQPSIDSKSIDGFVLGGMRAEILM